MMHSFEDKTESLVRLLGSPSSNVTARQGDRVFNFHYLPGEWDALRAYLPKIRVRLEKLGYTPHIHSFTDIVSSIFDGKGKKAIDAMTSAEGKTNLPHKAYTGTLQQFLIGPELSLTSPIVTALIDILNQAEKTPKSVLLLTDVEMLHPLVRVSAFEQVLQGKFKVPSVIFYPGRRGTVGDNPSFLGFYNSDGNYRSTHIY
ncbi:DUF1788 domain-containing protein [Verrucomicrobiales bacterium]|nr:DUF1788 domain-containing protein [Verrucomicrobiales bacterium]